MHQILVNLLRNAASETHPDGEISIRARNYEEVTDQDFALIQISDQGGGIPVEELPRVFSHLNMASRRSTAGAGEFIADLSIVKALVEAQEGRIWVDSEKGEGTTFSLLIPLVSFDRQDK
jgi:signal transduction histidine kinase